MSNDPFAFVRDALGVDVGYLAAGAQGPGYYLLAPQPEWLGRSYTAALSMARSLVDEAQPPEKFDWIGAARTLVTLLDATLPTEAGPPNRPYDDYLPD